MREYIFSERGEHMKRFMALLCVLALSATLLCGCVNSGSDTTTENFVGNIEIAND